MANYIGSPGNDSYLGTAGADSINGLAGNDTLDGAAGNDSIWGGSGDDSLIGGDGNDLLLGEAGNDTIRAGQGNDTLDGGEGENYADYRNAPAAVTVNLVTNRAQDGQGGTDTLISIRGAIGSAFADTLLGNDGKNAFAGGGGDDTIVGGGGLDFVYYGDASAAVSVNLANERGGGGSEGLDTLVSIEAAYGSIFNDTLVGSAVANLLQGDDGNDSLSGGDGDDTLQGDVGSDTLDGGAGSDWAAYSDASAAVNVSLASGSSSGADGSDTFLSIENLLGSNFNDTLTGDSGNNVIDGGPGNDTLRGGAGNDLLLGGAGADQIRADAGNDTIDGGAVLDRANYSDGNTLTFFDATSGVNLNLAGISGDGTVGQGTASDGFGGTDVVRNMQFITGSSYADLLVGSSAFIFESFEGGGGDDTIDGGAITDFIFTRDGNRANYTNADFAVSVDLALGTASGGAGNDTLRNINQLRGSAYNDTLLGSDATAYTEWFEGRAGNDTIDGRGGSDRARYDSAPSGVIASLVSGLVSDGYGTTDTLLNIEGLRGSAFADLLVGGNPANGTTAIGDAASDGLESFQGQAGDDTLDGGQGFDRAEYTTATGPINVTLGGSGPGTAQDGQGGTDTLISIEGIRAGEFADTLTGSDSAAFEAFDGRQGNDTIDGLGGIDQADYVFDQNQGVVVNLITGVALDGFGFTDTLRNIEWVRGTRGFGDILIGNDEANRLDGDGGNDSLSGGGGDDTLIAGTGDDTLDGGSGSDTVKLRGAFNTYRVSRPNDTEVLLLSPVTEERITLRSVELALFSDGLRAVADLIIGMGTDANETISGTAGADRIDAGAGDDSVLGLAGNDTLIGSTGNDTIDGGLGYDVASYAFASGPVNVSLASNSSSGADGNDTLRNIEALRGSGFADVLTGDANGNVLIGFEGADTLNGGAGLDVASYAGTVAVNVDLRIGRATQNIIIPGTTSQGTETDTLISIEAIFGSSAADVLRGFDGVGNAGETFRGNGGNDTIDGGTGVDTAEYIGNLADYTIARTPGTMNIVVSPKNGGGNGVNEGVDSLSNIEHLQFADRIVSFGARAEDVARVAFALWTPGIYGSQTLFSKGISFYDNEFNYSFDVLCQVALNYHAETGAALAAKLKSSIPAIGYSAAQLLDIMNANGGGDSISGRTAAVKAVALDAATTQQLELTGVTSKGVVATLNFDAEVYFGLLPG